MPTRLKYYLILGAALLLMAYMIGPSAAQANIPLPQSTLPALPVVARVNYITRANLEALATRYDIWEVHADEGYLIAMLLPEDLTDLQAAGYTVTVDVARTTELQTPRQILPGQVNGIPNYPCYRTVEETHTTLYNLVAAYPTLASVQDVGNSWERSMLGGLPGYDIYVLKLTNQAIPGPKPAFFLMGAIHAREYATAELATRFAEDLLSKYGSDADATWLLDQFEVHIMPMANPDGRKKAESGLPWRKNTDHDDGCNNLSLWGVDLNRNHSFEWGGAGASTQPCDATYRGPVAASEPEVLAIQEYVTGLFPDQRGPGSNDPAPLDASGLFITLHSYGRLVLWPWGHTNSLPPNAAGLQTLGRKFAYFNGYDPGQSIGLYPTTGTSDDWAYGELGIAAYTFELGNYFFESCNAFENTVFPDNLKAIYYAFKAARRPYQTPAGPETLNVTLTPGANHQITIQATANDQRFGGSGEPTQNIAAARYSFNLLSWQDGVSLFPLAAADGSFNSRVETVTANLDTTCIIPGRHTLYLESQDAAGNWGVPTATFLRVDAHLDPRWLPTTQSVEAQPGETLTYTVQAANGGNIGDTFTITMASQWPAALIPPIEALSLSACASTELTVTVTIPITAAPGSTDTLSLTLTSHGDPFQQTNATLISSVPGEITPPTPTITPPLPASFWVYFPYIVR